MGGPQLSSTPRLLPGAALLAARAVTLAGQRVVEVTDALAPLLPDGGLRRGSTIRLSGTGGISSLALILVAAATGSGAWVAAVGLPSLGLVAAAQLGVALERLALVPAPGPQWAVVTAALLDSVEIVLVAPSGRVGAADARRLVARARERGAVLAVVDPPGGAARSRWPDAPDLQLTATAAVWDGLEAGAGHLRWRAVDVVVTGRRAATSARTGRILLPGRDGRVELVAPAPAPVPEPVASPATFAVLAG